MPYPAKLTPDMILEAARELLETQGPELPSMRTLADQLGVRASSLYRHYPDAATLKDALADLTCLGLLDAIRAVSADLTAAHDLQAAAHAYLAYARQHPHLYALMLAPRAAYTAGPGAAKDLWNAVLERVSAVTDTPDDTAATVAFWAYLHGYVILEQSGQFGSSGPKGGFERGLEALVQGFQAQQAPR